MPRTDRAFDIRAEHPKRIHVDRQMKKIRMKKAARDQLPHLESDGTIELGDNKMANRPEREASQEPLARYRFQGENSDVYADEQSCESRHKNSLTASAHLHTKVTKDHCGHNVTGSPSNTTTQIPPREKNETQSSPLLRLRPESEKVSCVPALLRYFGAEVCVVMLA